MKPYYEDGAVTIYHGDCREVLPQLSQIEAVITDPPWPTESFYVRGNDESWELMAEAARWASIHSRRLGVHLSATIDPRWLNCVPTTLPFLCTRWLDYARPAYNRGRTLSADVALVLQFSVPREKHINCHPHCLHLWRPTQSIIPLPPPATVAPPQPERAEP